MAEIFVGVLVRPISPMPRRPGHRACRTGLARTSGCSASSASYRVCSYPTILKAASTRPRSTTQSEPHLRQDGDTLQRRHSPTRPRKPKDKAAVEAGVRFAQYYILGRLRNVTFFSLAECNAAIAAAMERMNSREMRRLGASRRQLFETVERRSCSPCLMMTTSMPNGI